VPLARLAVEPVDAALVEGFERIRRELKVPDAFAPEVATAAARARPAPRDVPDRRDLELVTLDPLGSRDLDQAFAIARRASGYTVFYAIADVAAFVAPGDPIDVEAHARGLTLYSPDRRTPLHPDSIGEGAASLLPGEDRPAVLWELDLDGDGAPVATRVGRATVRSRAALDYGAAQHALDAGSADDALVLLREVGRLRIAQEAARGGLSLDLPTQKVVVTGGPARLEYVTPLPVEGWNAQLSLLTGLEAARMMEAGGVGILRTLPPPDRRTLAAIRRSAHALGVPWSKNESFADFVRGIDRSSTAAAALLAQVARALRGAGYAVFDGAVPEHDQHDALAAPYAHVTAPIRRLCDRYANEVVLALAADRRPPAWVVDALPELPHTMAAARQRERALSNACLDFMEAVALEHRVGDVFPATVTNIDERGAVIQVCEPAVLARMDPGGRSLGEQLDVRLVQADPDARAVRFEAVGSVA
jgi:exoribonuclease R